VAKEKRLQRINVRRIPRTIKTLASRGANIFNPESVKETIAEQKTWCINRKHLVTNIYTTFLKFLGMNLTPPIYRYVEKLPFIPTEKEINEIIAGSSRKLGTYIQLLKETGMRKGEAWKLRWNDVDIERRTVTVNDPEKGSKPRIFNISSQLTAKLELLPKQTEYVFRKTDSQSLNNWTTNFLNRRKTFAKKMNNPRRQKITFKTFRHYKGTVLYHQTKDILYVKEVLGHKNIQNTLIYIHLEAAIFKSGDEDFTVRTAKTLQETVKLGEVGFEPFVVIIGVQLFRKKK
jgi:integrase